MSQTLTVPERFNKNALNVRALGTPARTGKWLIEYMCQRLGAPNLGNFDVLDLGCGYRFAEAIINTPLAVKSYTGIDLDQEMIEFLTQHVVDSRLRFYHWNAHNPSYNPSGVALNSNIGLPSDPHTFDVICMFSVITHQLPTDALMLFRILRGRIRPRGRMFFSVNLQEMSEGYREMIPDNPTGFSAYSYDFIRLLLKSADWLILSQEGKEPGGVPIQDSILCAPA